MAANPELLRLIDSITREKGVDARVLFEALDAALTAAVHKRFSEEDDVRVVMDRNTGDFRAFHNGKQISVPDLGRIAAQTAKQVIIQKIREAEQGALYGEYADRRFDLVNGVVSRFERDNVVVSLGNGEAVLPRSERVVGEREHYRVGDRIRAVVIDVEKVGSRVRIVLSRRHPDMIRRLFELEVPEINAGIIEIRHLAREPGYRTKIAVWSHDPKIDCVGACVGVRGGRIRNIIEELNNEKIDIIRWNDSAEVLIMNALKPAEIQSLTLNDDTKSAEVVVADDQLSLAIGKKGQNVRLAAKLTGWDINIVAAADATVQASATAFEEGDGGGDYVGDGEGPLPEPPADAADLGGGGATAVAPEERG
jgi:transcription termination/antitermination protein NusA